MPQDGDDVELKNIPEPLGPLGPWATGRVDWGPLSGMTGIRPVVDHYTITRYSTGEWRARNDDIITRAKNSMIQSEMYGTIVFYSYNNGTKIISAFRRIVRIQLQGFKLARTRIRRIIQNVCSQEHGMLINGRKHWSVLFMQ